MDKKENIKEYLQELLNKWNKYDELDGMTAGSFRIDLEMLLKYWDLRIEDKKIEIPFSMEDLEDLQHGEQFDWIFDGIDVHLYSEESDLL